MICYSANPESFGTFLPANGRQIGVHSKPNFDI